MLNIIFLVFLFFCNFINGMDPRPQATCNAGNGKPISESSAGRPVFAPDYGVPKGRITRNNTRRKPGEDDQLPPPKQPEGSDSSGNKRPPHKELEFSKEESNKFRELSSEEREKFHDYDQYTWDNYFKKYDHYARSPKQWPIEEQKEIFEQYNLYQFYEFRCYIKRLPGYEEHMLDLGNKIRHDPSFKTKILSVDQGWPKEWNEIKKARDGEASLRDFAIESTLEIERKKKERLKEQEKLLEQKNNPVPTINQENNEGVKENKETQPIVVINNPDEIAPVPNPTPPQPPKPNPIIRTHDYKRSENTDSTFRESKNEFDYIDTKNSIFSKQRNTGIQKIKIFGERSFTHTYKISQESYSSLQKLGIDAKSYEQFTGNIIQQQLHQENILQLNCVSEIWNEFQEVEEIREYAEFTIEFINLSHEMNKQGNLEAGYAFSDFCNNACAIGRGVKIAAKDSVTNAISLLKNVLDGIAHPLDTANKLHEIADSAKTNLGKAIYYAVTDPNGSANYVADIAIKTYAAAIEYYQNTPREELLENVGYFLTSQAIQRIASGPLGILGKAAKIPGPVLVKNVVEGQKQLKKLGKIGKEAARIAGTAAEKEWEIRKILVAVKEKFKKDIKQLKPIRMKGQMKGKNRNKIRYNTELDGGLDGAKSVFECLTGKKPIGNKDIFTFDNRNQVIFRVEGSSGHPKIEIKDSEYWQKITFKK